MNELSLHVLDVVQNSVSAGSTLIEINVDEDRNANVLFIGIVDNGQGMDFYTLKKADDPFFTSRDTMSVGLGLSLLRECAEQCGGSFEILSEAGKGTSVSCSFVYDHIDRLPLGNMAETISILVFVNPDIDFIYNHSFNQRYFSFSTRECRDVLGESINLRTAEVIYWIKHHIRQNINNLQSTDCSVYI